MTFEYLSVVEIFSDGVVMQTDVIVPLKNNFIRIK